MRKKSKIPVFEKMDIEKCCGCEACSQICPKEAIYMNEDEEGFLFPFLDKGKCVNCHLCEQVCPVLNQHKNKILSQKYYAGYAKDSLIVEESSSGGMFSIIANEFIGMEGDNYVCGVVWKDDFKGTKHICVSGKEGLTDLKRSKYIQSEKKNVYIEIKQLLTAGKNVMFVGCPCEVAGLHSYLGKQYSNLYSVDLVCQGPTSPKAMREFVEEQEKKYKSKICDLNMRYVGGTTWIPQWMKIKFESGKEVLKVFYETDIGRALHIMQRPSCYQCAFAGTKRYSDITLGDFHGADPNRNYYNARGTSIIITNTSKGADLWKHILQKDLVNIEVVQKDEITKSNPRIEKSWEPHKYRKIYSEYFVKYGIKKADKISRTQKERIMIHIPYKIRPMVRRVYKIVKGKN